MPDDWRLRVELDQERAARELTDRLEAFDREHDLKTSFRDRVVVSRDGSSVFCYTDSRDQAEATARAIDELASQHDWRVNKALERWHPTAERWEDASDLVPQSAEELSREHAELIEREREESRTQGYPMFEVRIRCRSHADARALAQKLEGEGIATAHRWRFVVVGAPDEDAANALGERLRGEAPPGCAVEVGGSIAEVAHDAPLATPFSPFAVFGGLGS